MTQPVVLGVYKCHMKESFDPEILAIFILLSLYMYMYIRDDTAYPMPCDNHTFG